MQTIEKSVGEGGINAISDVALIQAILVKTQRVATRTVPAAPYLSTYDGICGNNTKNAIRAFQYDHVFVSPDGTQSIANSNAKAGLVMPNDATWQKLLEKIPAEFADLRVLNGSKTVYVAATAAQLQNKIAVANAMTFVPAFRMKVIACINRMHAIYGIAIGVCRQGDRRHFQAQYELLTGGRGVTKAGPGESNHNFGMAVDLGFDGLRWLRNNGTLVEDETSWLHKLDPGQSLSAEALKFWEALRSIGTSPEVGLFHGPVGDRPHLQNWNDAGVHMSARLADLLTRSGTMRWSGRSQRYQCNLGMGSELFEVGSAAQIWNRQASVTIEMLTKARALMVTGQQRPVILAHPSMPLHQPLGTPQSGVRPVGGVPPQAVTQADVIAMQQELRRQFDLADSNWQNWTPH